MSYRILLVEDDPICRELYKELLERAGHHVTEVSTVKDALKHLAAELPHLLITDIGLPDRSGCELLIEVRRNPRWHFVMVLVLTARDTPSDHEYLMDMGADAYVSKTQPGGVFLPTVQGLLRRLELDRRVLRLGDLLFDRRVKCLYVSDQVIKTLNRDEFDFLFLLAERSPYPVSAEELGKKLAAMEPGRNLEAVISSLKAKLPGSVMHGLKPVSGVGYSFNMD